MNWFFTFGGINVRNIWVVLFCDCRKMCFCWKFWMCSLYVQECSKNIVFYVCYYKFNIERSILMICFGKACHRNIMYYWYFSLVGNCKSFFSMSFGTLRFNCFAITWNVGRFKTEMEAPVSKRNRISNFDGNMFSFLSKACKYSG